MGREPRRVTKTFYSHNGKPMSIEVELFTWEKLDYVKRIRETFGMEN